jgi:hypothetical protein
MLTILTWFASVAIHRPDAIGIAIIVCLCAWAGGVGGTDGRAADQPKNALNHPTFFSFINYGIPIAMRKFVVDEGNFGAKFDRVGNQVAAG